MNFAAATATIRRSRPWWVITAVLLLIAASALGVDRRDQTGQERLVPPTAPSTAPTPAANTVAPSTPIGLRIPAIGVAVSVSALGLNPDGTVQVPTNFDEPGWFRLGPSPGEVGTAVILGHVDSTKGPAVFFRLRQLQAGDPVEVSLADGVVVYFTVVSVVMYPKDQFPADLVYGSHGYSALQLVTCGGVFDQAAHSYRSNVVVYTSLVATTPTDRDQTEDTSIRIPVSEPPRLWWRS
jgi:sortase (surface protein transpeptidase)